MHAFLWVNDLNEQRQLILKLNLYALFLNERDWFFFIMGIKWELNVYKWNDKYGTESYIYETHNYGLFGIYICNQKIYPAVLFLVYAF